MKSKNKNTKKSGQATISFPRSASRAVSIVDQSRARSTLEPRSVQIRPVSKFRHNAIPSSIPSRSKSVAPSLPSSSLKSLKADPVPPILLQVPKKETQSYWNNRLKPPYPFPEVQLTQLNNSALEVRISEIERDERKTYTQEVESAQDRKKKSKDDKQVDLLSKSLNSKTLVGGLRKKLK